MKTLFAQILVGIAAVALPAPALGAISLSLNPSIQDNQVAVDVVIHGLGEISAPSLSDFAITLAYDPAMLAETGAAFGNYLDLGNMGSIRFSPFLPPQEEWNALWPEWPTFYGPPGMVRLIEVSSESSDDLIAAQPGSFTLATVLFDVLAPGTSIIDIGYQSLSGERGPTHGLAALTSGATIQIPGATPVPDAGLTAWLLALGLMSLVALRTSARARHPVPGVSSY